MKLNIFSNQIDFTTSEKVVISYLENHLNEIDGLTITDLAKKSLTSNATIIRLSHKLGYDGFKDLKVNIIKNIETNRFTNNQVDFSFPFSPIDDLNTIKNSMTDLYLNGLTLLRNKIKMSDIKKVANLILTSKNTFIFANGDTGITSKSFINKVNKLNVYPILATENGEENNITTRMNEHDLAIFISYDKYASQYNEEIEIPKKKHVNFIIITANTDPAVFAQATVGIAIPNEEKSNKVATFYSQFAFHFVLNLIFSVLYQAKMLN